MQTEPANFGLKASIISQIIDVFSNYPDIEKVVIYGSRAKGNFRNGSDIDLTLVGDNLTYELLNRIETQLDNLMLVYTIDLSLFKYIDSPELIDHINRVGKVFYSASQS